MNGIKVAEVRNLGPHFKAAASVATQTKDLKNEFNSTLC